MYVNLTMVTEAESCRCRVQTGALRSAPCSWVGFGSRHVTPSVSASDGGAGGEYAALSLSRSLCSSLSKSHGYTALLALLVLVGCC